MVAGLEEITEGRITIGDRVVNEVPPKDRDIAMVFQNDELYPHMTVLAEETRELAVDRGAEALQELEVRAEERTSPFVARFSGRSSVQEGELVDVWVDTQALHLFDPEMGRGIYEAP